MAPPSAIKNIPIAKGDPLLQCRDENGNSGPDPGEVCFFESGDETNYFKYLGMIQGNHHLEYRSGLNDDESGTGFLYSSERGFLFQKEDSEGNIILIASGNHPDDISAYKLFGHLPKTGLESSTNEFVSESLPFVPPMNVFYYQAAWPVNWTFRSVLMDTLKDEGFLKRVNVSSINELKLKYKIETEGSAIHIVNFAPQAVRTLAVDNGAYAFNSDRLVVIDRDLIEKTVENKQESENEKWRRALRIDVFHECYHLDDPYNFLRSNYDQYPEPFIGNLPETLLSSPSIEEEIEDLSQSNGGFHNLMNEYQSYYTEDSSPSQRTLVARNVFGRALAEIRANIAACDYMLDIGLENLPYAYRSEKRTYFVAYLDMLYFLHKLPGGEEFLRKTLEPIANNEQMKEFIFNGPVAKEIDTPYFKARLSELEKFLS